VASGEYGAALKVLESVSTQDLPASGFLRAQAYAGLSRWAEALPLYQACDADGACRFRAEALFGTAESLRATGQIDEALAALGRLTSDEKSRTRASMIAVELLLQKGDITGATRVLNGASPTTPGDRNEKRLLRGRIEAARGHHEKAAQLFVSILKKPEATAHSVIIAALFAVAEAHLQLGTPAAGDDFLEGFIEHHPAEPNLPAVFAKLDQLYAAEKKPSRNELGRWSRDPAQPRRALAQWYLARQELRLGNRDRALQSFALLGGDCPALPALAEALYEYAELQVQERSAEEVAALLDKAEALHPEPAVAARIAALAGRNQYFGKQFSAAGQTFLRLSQNSAYAKEALFDASLAWMQAGDLKQAALASDELAKDGGDEQSRGELLLERGLAQALHCDREAPDTLRSFLRDFPKHARVSEAWVALAELSFRASPPQLEQARQDLARAAENQPAAAAEERADYLAIWIEEAAPAPNDEKVIVLANHFLEKHAQSALLPEVRLKLAETYFRRQDFTNAQMQFEILAQSNSTSAAAEKAQFFGAESAMRSMGNASLDRALLLFDAVVKRDGEMKWAARNEQAIIERKIGKPQDALTLYDEVLKGNAQTAEKREALCGKGDVYYELGPTDPENYRRALEIYAQLAAQPDGSEHWRNQALFKKGMCQQKLQLPAEALATFYEIIENSGKPERRREFFWYYKAGFNAARLLEEDAKWQPAAAIYEKLAFAGGARSEEAKARLNRLRLEHFLWDK
ncbi:MAG: tetratricopeptide repeat protein, partial [Verrucomicrobiota bacterium]|nr:tetratricopeptide repeat protein [Verrucomicrobiota bacterium]